MKERRQFLKAALGLLAGAGIFLPSFLSTRRPFRGEEQNSASSKKVSRENLTHMDPAKVDTSNLEITPLKDFQTMGSTGYKVDREKWRLEVTGRVKKQLSLTYPQILDLPCAEKAVLLICPGFFANHGLWKGILMSELLKRAEAEDGAAQVIFCSREGEYERNEKFSTTEVLGNQVFLAYGVNQETLPEKHGFPLRVVAEGHYGSRWLKYVSLIKVE